MNNNELESGSNNIYKATTNLNTAIDNPIADIDNVMDVNIQNTNYNNSFNINNSQVLNDYSTNNFNQTINTNNQFVPNNNVQELNGMNNSQTSFIPNNVQTVNSTASYNTIVDNSNEIPKEEKIVYEPTMKAKKKPISIELPKELKMLIILVIILVLFLFVMPSIYDILSKLSLDIRTR